MLCPCIEIMEDYKPWLPGNIISSLVYQHQLNNGLFLLWALSLGDITWAIGHCFDVTDTKLPIPLNVFFFKFTHPQEERR